MFCYNCGKEIPDNAMYCMYCGTQVNVKLADEVNAEPAQEPAVESPETEEVPVTTVDADTESTTESATETKEPGEREMAPHAISSLVWAIVANDLSFIPILGLIFSIIALTKSKRGRNIVAGNPEHYKCKGMLTAALILGIIDLVASIIAPLILFAYTSIFSKIFEISEFSDIFTGFA